MKKLFVGSIIILILLLLLFKIPTDKDNLYELQKTINNFENYSTISNITIMNQNKKSTYKIEETFVKPDKFKLKIIEPKETKGCIIIYNGNRLFLNQPIIGQSISIDKVDSLDKELFMGDFFRNINLLEESHITQETIEDEKYIVIKIPMINKSDLRYYQKVWFNIKDFTPYKLNLLDKHDNVSVEILYENFCYDTVIEEEF